MVMGGGVSRIMVVVESLVSSRGQWVVGGCDCEQYLCGGDDSGMVRGWQL